MKICSIFYTDAKFKSRERHLLDYLRSIGFDDVINYNREWLVKTDFYLDNKEILDMPRGGGYWLWKPYIIIDAMKGLKDEDVVFYMDAGDHINGGILKQIKKYILNHDYIITNGSGHRPLNKIYTKKDCFVLMNCNEDKYYNISQIEAGVLVFKKNKFIENFLEEWLFYCKNKNIITDMSNICGENFNGFIDHRHDQSILTNLTVKYGMNYSDVLLSDITYNSFKP